MYSEVPAEPHKDRLGALRCRTLKGREDRYAGSGKSLNNVSVAAKVISHM